MALVRLAEVGPLIGRGGLLSQLSGRGAGLTRTNESDEEVNTDTNYDQWKVVDSTKLHKIKLLE